MAKYSKRPFFAPMCIYIYIYTRVLGAMYSDGLADGIWEVVMEYPNFPVIPTDRFLE